MIQIRNTVIARQKFLMMNLTGKVYHFLFCERLYYFDRPIYWFIYWFFLFILILFESCRIGETATAEDEVESTTIRGNDDCLGRIIEKDFGQLGKFKGRVDGVDNDSNNSGHRLFHVTYCDGDDEWMSAAELKTILLSISSSTVRLMFVM